MKKIICFVLLSILFQTVISQNKRTFKDKIGFSFNLNYLYLNKVKVKDPFYDSIISKNKFGYILSLNLDYKILNNFKIETGVGFEQRHYYYDEFTNCPSSPSGYIYAYKQDVRYNYIQIPLSIIYEKSLTKKISAIGILSLYYNVFKNYKNKVDDINGFNQYCTYFGSINFYSLAINPGIIFKYNDTIKIPLTISFEINNNKIIGSTTYQNLLINSFILGIKTGFYFN
jgi:hypothetical protein